MADLKHVSMEALTAGLGGVRQSPATIGVLELIVRRPRTDVREVVEVADLDVVEGLVGDGWKTRGSSKTDDGSAELERQLTVTNARLMALVAREKRHWPPAGDQLYVDFDLSADNAPSGTRLSIGAAVIQVTETPHTGCRKFAARYGLDALKFISTPVGKQLRLRGVNAKVIRSGTIRAGERAGWGARTICLQWAVPTGPAAGTLPHESCNRRSSISRGRSPLPNPTMWWSAAAARRASERRWPPHATG